MTLESSAYMLAFFLTVYGLVYTWLAVTIPKRPGGFFQLKNVLGIVAVLYIMFAHLVGLTSLAYGIEYANTPVCENLPTLVRETYQYGNNYTGYHWDYDVGDAPSCANPTDTSCVNLFHRNITTTYTNSCDDRAEPTALSYTYKVLAYLIYGGYLALFFGGIYLLFRWTLGGRW